MKQVNFKLLAILVVIGFLTTGCFATMMTGAAKVTFVQDPQSIKDFDTTMTTFIASWPYISGAIDGAYEGRTFQVPSGLVESKKEIDRLVGGFGDYPAKNSHSAYEKGKIATLWGSMVTGELIRWLKEVRPDILKLIPAGLLAI